MYNEANPGMGFRGFTNDFGETHPPELVMPFDRGFPAQQHPPSSNTTGREGDTKSKISADGGVFREISRSWYVPRFEFKLGGWPTVLEVSVWPWLAIRSLVVRVGDRIVYAEGEGPWKSKPRLSGDWADLA